MTSVFMGFPADWEEYFKRCIEREAVTAKDKANILRELIEERRVTYLGDTDKSKEDLAKDISDQGINVYNVSKRTKE